MIDEHTRAVLTALSLFGILGPSVIFVGLAIGRMLQAFSRFGKAAGTMRRRLLLEHIFLGGIGVCFFLVFEDIWPVGDAAVKGFLFMAGFVVYLWTCGFSFLSWDLWSSGSGRRARRRPVDVAPSAALEADEPTIVTTLEHLAATIPTIRIVHVFGEDPVPAPLAKARPSQTTAA